MRIRLTDEDKIKVMRKKGRIKELEKIWKKDDHKYDVVVEHMEWMYQLEMKALRTEEWIKVRMKETKKWKEG